MAPTQLSRDQLLQDWHQPPRIGGPEPSLLLVAVDRGPRLCVRCWYMVALRYLQHRPVPSLHQRLQLRPQRTGWCHQGQLHEDESCCCQREPMVHRRSCLGNISAYALKKEQLNQPTLHGCTAQEPRWVSFTSSLISSNPVIVHCPFCYISSIVCILEQSNTLISSLHVPLPCLSLYSRTTICTIQSEADKVAFTSGSDQSRLPLCRAVSTRRGQVNFPSPPTRSPP
jgi:hypothetical protein